MGIVKDVNGKNKTLTGMRKVIDYITQIEKVKSEEFIFAKNCDTTNPYLSFLTTKRIYNKDKGRQFKHFVHSFKKYEDISDETLLQIANEFLEHSIFDGYQVIGGVHFDKEHKHIHYVINSVNADTGAKWSHSTKEMKELIDYSNELCEKYNITSLEMYEGRKKHNSQSRGEWQARKEGRSWKAEMSSAVRQCKFNATSKEDFINKMNDLGYKVNWTDTRKYITFENADGKKMRNNKMYNSEQFTKGALEERFDLNQQRVDFEKDKMQNDVLKSFSMFERMFSGGNDTQGKGSKVALLELEGKEQRKDERKEAEKGRGFDWDNEK